MVTNKLRDKHHNTDNFWLKSLMVLFLCIGAGFIGAKLQSLKASPAAENNKSIVDNTQLNELADEIGHLKGRLMALRAVRNSFARSSGLESQMAEIQSQPDYEIDNIPLAIQNTNKQISLDDVASQLADLRQDVSLEEDLAYFMDLSLSDQTGFHASLPTLAPVQYPALSSSFGWRKNPVSGKNTMHEGLDFAAPFGAPISASSGGIVTYAGRLGSYGNMVEIDHGNGLVSRYAHTSKITVKTGDLVSQGQQIASVGNTGRSTGAHLHFEIRMADYPLDPRLFIEQSLFNNKVLANNDIPTSANKS